jgi:hypothetical protein
MRSPRYHFSYFPTVKRLKSSRDFPFSRSFNPHPFTIIIEPPTAHRSM